MSRVRRLAWVCAVCALSGNLARAAPISSQGWTYWTVGSNSPGPTDPSLSSSPSFTPNIPSPTPSPQTFSPNIPSPTPSAQALSGTTYDARLDLGPGPYPLASALTTGGAQPWYNSSQITGLFGGTPTAAQQTAFDNTVLQRVQQTFQLGGIPVTLTTDPNAQAAHTLSLVSNTTSTWGPVLGLTEMTNSGFSFIDQAAKSAQSVDQLEWLVAHNIAHELMLAFGVGENYDTSGKFIDAKMASLSMMLDPNATFSSAAAQALLAQNFLANPSDPTSVPSAQLLPPQTVPEPGQVVLWVLATGAIVLARRGANS